ncbi:MAG: serine/threonine-protein kinase [Phycisphaerales bacterium JB065]
MNNSESSKRSDFSEGTKLPMPEDSAAPRSRQASGDSSEDSRLPMPEDTVEILTGRKDGKSPSEDSNSGSSAAGGTAIGSMDTIVGRLVIEQGLATDDEVKSAIAKVAGGSDPSDKSLAEILVNKGVITKAQLDRLRKQVEAERSGQQIPGYRVLGKLGAGAMAAVFKARQISLDRLVAIKVLPRKFNGNRQFIERFYAEGRAAAQLNHPNIVQAFDVGKAGEFHYFVMEYVDGGTVHDTIVQNKRFDEADAINIAINVAEALEHAHERGLIHRDVKPKNVMITKGGVTKLADLGLARAIDDKDAALAEKGKAYGTPYYISPEQIRGEVNVGPQADIYSLGATLYHMVTGNVPYNGKNPKEVMEKHLKQALIPPDHVNPKLSAGISEVIEMMMAKSRRERYKNCKDLLIDLRAVKRGEDPPIAHKETTPDALLEVANLQKSIDVASSGMIPIDQSRPKGIWAEPVVKGLVSAVVILIVLLLGLVAFVASSL